MKSISDFLKQKPYRCFSTDLANEIGMNEAVLFGVIVGLQENENGLVKIKSDFIKTATSLTERQQKPTLKRLCELGLIMEPILKGAPPVKHTRLTFDCLEVLQRLIKSDKTYNSEIKHSVKGESNETYNLPLTKGVTQDQQSVQNNVQSVDLLVDESIILINRDKPKKPKAKKFVDFKDTDYASDNYEVAQAAWMDAFGTNKRFDNCDWEYYQQVILNHSLNVPKYNEKVNWKAAVQNWILKDTRMRTIGNANQNNNNQQPFMTYQEKAQAKREAAWNQAVYDVFAPRQEDTNAIPF